MRSTHTNPEVRLARIMSKIEPEPMSGCHIWLGTRDPHGYGMILVGYKGERVHRWLYQQVHGVMLEPAPIQCVLHRCGNRACVNLAHLYVGTQKDNAEDARRHGTFAGFQAGLDARRSKPFLRGDDWRRAARWNRP